MSTMTRTTTKTVGVNAAFLQEIKEENQELRDLLHRTVCCFETLGPATPCVKMLAELLEQLRDQFSIHFSLEEAFGYFEDAISVAPHLSIQAERLRGEHEDLFIEVCRLADVAERFLYQEPTSKTVQRLATGWSIFYARFRLHEEEETDLIFSAFDDDIGVGD